MNTYLTIMLPISGLYFLVMVVILYSYEKSRRKYNSMLEKGYYFVWTRTTYLGVSPELVDRLGIISQPAP